MSYLELFRLVVDMLLGLIAVPFVDWIKGILNWSEGKAVLLAGAVAALLALAELLLSQQLGWVDFGWDKLVYTLALVFAAATVWYKRLKYGKQSRRSQ